MRDVPQSERRVHSMTPPSEVRAGGGGNQTSEMTRRHACRIISLVIPSVVGVIWAWRLSGPTPATALPLITWVKPNRGWYRSSNGGKGAWLWSE